MAEKGSQSQFCSGNIANIIPGSPLKKMIPLMEDHEGGGVHGDPCWLMDYHGRYTRYVCVHIIVRQPGTYTLH